MCILYINWQCIYSFLIEEDVDFAELLCQSSEYSNYSPFGSKAEALLFMMIHSPCPLVSC